MLIIAEGLVGELDPDFRFAEALAPYARRHFVSEIAPGDVIRRLEEFGLDLAELAAELPSRLNRISEAIETGGFEVQVRSVDTEALLARAERIGNRVAASVLVAAAIDGVVQIAMRRRRRGPRLRRGRKTASVGRMAFVRSKARQR